MNNRANWSLVDNWHLYVIILLLLSLVSSLLGQLARARANEREMSLRVYQAVKQGYYNSNTNHAK